MLNVEYLDSIFMYKGTMKFGIKRNTDDDVKITTERDDKIMQCFIKHIL